MSLESDEVRVTATGHIWTAPWTSTIASNFPATIAASPNEGYWLEHGYTAPEGCHLIFDRTSKDIMGWQSREALRTVITAVPKRVEFTLLQWNQYTWALANGGGTWTGSTGSGEYTPPTPGYVDNRGGILEVVDGSFSYRFLIRKWLNTAPLDVMFNAEDAAHLPISMSILAASGGDSSWTMQTNDDNLILAASAGS